MCDVFALLIAIYSRMGQLALHKANCFESQNELLCVKQTVLKVKMNCFA
jgi:hypothetical protein